MGAIASELDHAVIKDSGSTNALGYEIKIYSDGTGVITQSGKSYKFAVSENLAEQFFEEVAQAEKAQLQSGLCAKSVSFGETLRLEWHGYVYNDLTCPGDRTGPLTTSLIRDSNEIDNQAEKALGTN